MPKTKRYFIKIYGCLFNHADAERVRTILNKQGYKEVFSDKEADYVIVLTCSVREKAEHKVIAYTQKLKQKNPSTKAIISGCMVRRDYLDHDNTRTKERLKRLEKVMPSADAFFDITNLDKLPELLEGKIDYHDLVFNRDVSKSYIDLIPTTLQDNSIVASIPIMTGCNEFCTFCIVPYTRGKERYRSFESILEEVESAIKSGKKIIYLLGQIVDKWKDEKANKTFIDLLKEIESLPYDFLFSFTSPHPNYITPEVIDFIARGEKIMKHLGLPLQSGSNKVLAAMNRKYTKEQYLKIAKYSRKKIPNLYLTTDIIVGFPPETDEDFEETIEVIKTLKFDKVFFAKYSPRHNMHKDIVHDVEYQKIVQKRFDRLNRLVNKIFAQRNKAQIGKEYIGVISSENQATSIRNQIVDIPYNTLPVGTWVKMKITGGGRRGVMGEIIEHAENLSLLRSS